MDESLKVFAKQLGKTAEKQPGWIYLLAAIYLALFAFGVPGQLDIAGWRLPVPKLSAEVWATLLALVLYQVGDALDKVTFKKRGKEGKWVDRFQPETFKVAIKAARDRFGVNDGIYDVSMKILEKAKQAKFSVHFLNEMAKFFRSLIAPGLAIAIVFSLKLTLPWALLLVALALLCTYVLAVQVYPRFKNLHRINLYRAVVELPAEDLEKITCEELGTVRMFFWEGTLVASAPKPANLVMPMCKDRCQEALGYWTIGLQYLHLVEAVIAETIEQKNAHVVVSDEKISWDQYERHTRWSDHQLVIPVLFDFYHGLEVIMKGFLVAADAAPQKNHKLSQLLAAFEKLHPSHAIGATIGKYIAQDQLPEVLASFCKTSGISIDDYYQALKYPQSTRGDVYKHYPLKYKGEEGVPFFEGLSKDIGEIVPKIVALGRSICPSA